MNKNLLTNVIALVLIGVGLALPNPHLESLGCYAFSGAITNWLAIYMLFERVPGLYGTGVIPKHFETFKQGIRGLIMEEFFTLENIQRLIALSHTQFSAVPAQLISVVDFDRLFDNLVTVILDSSFGTMLNMIGGRSALAPLQQPVIEKIQSQLLTLFNEPNTQSALQTALFAGQDEKLFVQIQTILTHRLDELTPKMVKEIIQKMIRRHLGWLTVWGGVIGGVLGLAVSFFS